MGGRRWSAVGLLSLLLALVTLPAGAVGSGDPTIENPSVGAALYAGYSGPFRMNFDNAPKGDYDWAVTRTSPAPSTVVDQGVYPNDGFGVPEPIQTTALSAGGYTFTISDTATHTHTATRPFTVRSGAAPTCGVVVPSKVRVNQPVEKVATHLGSRCAELNVSYASWKVLDAARDFAGSLVFDATSTDTWTVFDDDRMGRYLVQPKSGRSADDTEVPQNSPTPVVRRDSRLAFGGWRSGGYATARATLTRYSAAADAFRPWASAHVVLSYRSCRTCAWHWLRTMTTSSHGQAGYRFRSSSTRDYRMTSAGTDQTWAPLPRYGRF